MNFALVNCAEKYGFVQKVGQKYYVHRESGDKRLGFRAETFLDKAM
jgi:hypothetical protein